jgi:hypothetical protein
MRQRVMKAAPFIDRHLRTARQPCRTSTVSQWMTLMTSWICVDIVL